MAVFKSSYSNARLLVCFWIGDQKRGPMATGAGEVPFILWMLAGLIPWFFISPTILDGSNSVFKRIKMVAKMNFPISSLPSVAIASNLFSYAIMMVIYIIALLASGIYPSLHWLQYIYYFVCLMAFLFSFSLFNSTISVLIRDYQFLLQAVTRLLFSSCRFFGTFTRNWGQITRNWCRS